MRSMPGKRLVGKRDADVHEDARRPRTQPEDVLAELADAAERDDLERHAGGRQSRASARKSSSESSSARARGLRPRASRARSHPARGPAEASALPSVLRRRVEAERGEAQGAAHEVRIERFGTRRRARARSRQTFGRGRNAPGGRSKRIAAGRVRRDADGEIPVRLVARARDEPARHLPLHRRDRRGGSSRLLDRPRVRIGVATLYGRFATRMAGPAQTAPRLEPGAERAAEHVALEDADARVEPRAPRRERAARSGSISTATSAAGAVAPGDGSARRRPARSRGRCRPGPTPRGGDDPLGRLAARQEVLTPALAGPGGRLRRGPSAAHAATACRRVTGTTAREAIKW